MQNLQYEETEKQAGLFKNEIAAKEITIEAEDKGTGYYFIKRVIDLTGSLCGIILLSPLFLIVSILIKLDSKGPVFFAHKRLGQNGTELKVYKFRTMVSNAEDLLKTMNPKLKREYEKNFKLDDDPRITKVGRTLRKTSLDELPQLFNILIGSMSIVGPRPIIEKEIEKYGIYFNKFISVKPGLTGNWQANGRSSTTYDERVQLDMEYINNRNTLFDIKIIFKTVISVLKEEGAC